MNAYEYESVFRSRDDMWYRGFFLSPRLQSFIHSAFNIESSPDSLHASHALASY